MAQPTAYAPATDFSDEEASSVGGRSTVRTAALDAELSAIQTTLQGVLTNLALIQRDDGDIRDGEVKLHTLAGDVRALLAAGNVEASNLRGAWLTATAYVPLDVVTQSANTYIATTAHTSGTFATDLAAGRWILLSLGATIGAAAVSFAPTATLAATTVQAAIEEADTENRALSAAASAAVTTLGTDIADTASATKGAAKVGYNSALAYAAGTVGFELNKRKSVFATGVAATDTAALQAAVTAAADYTTIEVFGTTLALNATITLKPKLRLKFNVVGVTFSSTSTNMFEYVPGTPTGFPGRIVIEGMRATGAGNTGSAWALKIDANCPYVMVKDCYIDAFYGGVYLRDAYLSHIEDTFIATVSHGIAFYRESHGSQAVNCFIDSATVTALSINYGATGGGPIHNIKVIGGAYQNSPVGIWAENALELHTVDVYHEGNSVNDYRIGVADAGVYARACYSVKIDGFSSASPCASGKNIQIEHSVGVQVLATGWNSGCSTTATLLSADGFCDRIEVDAHRFSTTTPTSTAPFDFTAIPERCVVRYRGRHIYGTGAVDGIAWGTLASTLARIGQQSISSRDTLLLYSALDIALRVTASTGIFRVQDDSGNDLFTVDNVNNKVVINKTSVQIPNFPNSNPGAGSKVLWYDPADGNRVKFAP